MLEQTIKRPEQTEYPTYFEKYVSLVPAGEINAILSGQLDETLSLLRSIPESEAGYRYAPDKWSIKELLGHIIDSERIFGYRALRFARNDMTALPGYEQDDYVRNALFDEHALADLAAEFESVRRSNLFLFKRLNEESWARKGLSNESEVSVRALAYIIAGHELHHMEILRSRYLHK